MSDVNRLPELSSEFTVVRRDELARLRGLAELIADLDRCDHGRLAGTLCVQCDRPGSRSAGNGYLPTGKRIGTTISRRLIVVPHPARRSDPKAWVR